MLRVTVTIAIYEIDEKKKTDTKWRLHFLINNWKLSDDKTINEIASLSRSLRSTCQLVSSSFSLTLFSCAATNSIVVVTKTKSEFVTLSCSKVTLVAFSAFFRRCQSRSKPNRGEKKEKNRCKCRSKNYALEPTSVASRMRTRKTFFFVCIRKCFIFCMEFLHCDALFRFDRLSALIPSHCLDIDWMTTSIKTTEMHFSFIVLCHWIVSANR